MGYTVVSCEDWIGLIFVMNPQLNGFHGLLKEVMWHDLEPSSSSSSIKWQELSDSTLIVMFFSWLSIALRR